MKEQLSSCETLIPIVSETELEEIQRRFGSPAGYSKEDFIDVTDWVKAQ